MKRIALTGFIIFGCLLKALAQNTGHTGVKHIMAAVDSLHKHRPSEKIYLHLDRPYYAIGDTIRFRAYVLDETLSPTAQSGIMYVELVNDSSQVVKRQTILLANGMASGDIVLIQKRQPGIYTLRSYTNWMRNFGEDGFFTRQIKIISTNGPYWLVNHQLNFDKDTNADLSLQFHDVDHKAVGFRDVDLRVMDGGSTLLKSKMRTGPMGEVELKFAMPPNQHKPLSVIAREIKSDSDTYKTVIPISINHYENTDVQFMPEGGSLIAGILIRVGFKAIGEDGKGVIINGAIINSKQQEITTFKTAHKGMGAFELTPQTGETYTAKVTLPDGKTKNYPLPLVTTSGIALCVKAIDKDSLQVTATASNDIAGMHSTYYLVGQARDKVCYAAKIVFQDRQVWKKIPVNIFPMGIAKFVLLDERNKPLTQRMVFVDRDDLLNISITANKESYSTRDSIGLQLAVSDAGGKPVQGSFSIAVTDDSRIKSFDKDVENIASYMLLNTDLKGNIEEPGYYFNKEHSDRKDALDYLLLTQGWVNYNWQQVFAAPEKLAYTAEEKFTVTGRASNLISLAVANTDVMLISTRPPVLMSAKTDKNGIFRFSNFPFLDTINFRLQTKKNFNIGIKVDEFVPPEFHPSKIEPTPWYIIKDSVMLNPVVKQQTQPDEPFNPGKSKLLKEVEIKSNRYVNPLDVPMLALNEEEIRTARTGKKPMTLLQLLDRKDHISGMDKEGYFFVDGDLLRDQATNKPYSNVELLAWLNEFTTEDIKGITAVRIHTERKEWGRMGLRVNVTTNLHVGNNTLPTGGYAYRPMPISWPHQFYSPRYTAKYDGKSDERTTIFWDPVMSTDVAGKTSLSFYSADVPGTYTVIIEGTDMNGNVGYKRQQLKIDSKQ
ncbi:MAG TPA: hypothetical protein VL490_11945 [Mucilaginibacter sp.]|nr:hypothetical protein [Mucilaginibacter sp.]